jgi:transposase
VRFSDVDVEGLNLEALGVQSATPKATGRPPEQPGELLQRYSSGELNKIRSSRQCAHETQRHVELRWLWRRLRPAFKPRADFRTDHAQARPQVGRDCTRLCQRGD